MAFKVIWTNDAIKDLHKLEHFIAKRILKKTRELKSKPYKNIKRLTALPYYRLRVGDYRIIFDIQQNRLIILIINVEHRKKVYKKL